MPDPREHPVEGRVTRKSDCGVCGVPETIEVQVTEGYSVPRCAGHTSHQPYQAESRLQLAASSLADLQAKWDDALTDLERVTDAYNKERGDLLARLSRAEEALRELVRLKDGPRDALYEIEKPLAWDRAREALAHPKERDG